MSPRNLRGKIIELGLPLREAETFRRDLGLRVLLLLLYSGFPAFFVPLFSASPMDVLLEGWSNQGSTSLL